jgi:alcohol dehydrogenase class IV
MRAASLCPTPRCTRSCCRTRPRTTAPARLRPWPGSRALDAEDAAQGLYDLAASLGDKLRLADLGLRESDLDRAAALAVESPYPNPTSITREGIRPLLDDAFHGRRPTR